MKAGLVLDDDMQGVRITFSNLAQE
jgi:hypothetical protein